jgi:microcystin-dependent protein
MSRDLVSQSVSQNTRKIPVGTIMLWPSSTIPKGWLLCDGTGFATATHPALYAVIGTTYGSSGGFQVPDMRTRVPYAVGSAGSTGGTASVTLSAAESALKNHTHTYVDYYPDSDFQACSGSNASSVKQGSIAGETTTGVYIGDTSYPSGVSASAAHTNLQPYLLLNFIIKY